jgi:hypothetical protein
VGLSVHLLGHVSPDLEDEPSAPGRLRERDAASVAEVEAHLLELREQGF